MGVSYIRGDPDRLQERSAHRERGDTFPCLPLGISSAWRGHGISVLAERSWLRPRGTSRKGGPVLKSLRAPEVVPNLNHSIIIAVLNFLDNYFQHLVVEFQLKSKHSRTLRFELY